MKLEYTVKNKTIYIDTETGIIDGQTFHLKDDIKYYFKNAQWDKSEKVWVVDPAEMAEAFQAKIDRYGADIWEKLGFVPAKEKTEVKVAADRTNYSNGLCPKCHTYCYGDCSAH